VSQTRLCPEDRARLRLLGNSSNPGAPSRLAGGGIGSDSQTLQVNWTASLPGCVACLASAPPRRVPEQWDTKRRKTEVLPQWRRALTGQRADRHENDKDDRQQTCVEPHDDGRWPCQLERCATKRSYCCRLTPWRSTSGRRGQYHCPTHRTPTPAHALSLTTACIVARSRRAVLGGPHTPPGACLHRNAHGHPMRTHAPTNITAVEAPPQLLRTAHSVPVPMVKHACTSRPKTASSASPISGSRTQLATKARATAGAALPP
jgi:hypothetical protein